MHLRSVGAAFYWRRAIRARSMKKGHLHMTKNMEKKEIKYLLNWTSDLIDGLNKRKAKGSQMSVTCWSLERDHEKN